MAGVDPSINSSCMEKNEEYSMPSVTETCREKRVSSTLRRVPDRENSCRTCLTKTKGPLFAATGGCGYSSVLCADGFLQIKYVKLCQTVTKYLEKRRRTHGVKRK